MNNESLEQPHELEVVDSYTTTGVYENTTNYRDVDGCWCCKFADYSYYEQGKYSKIECPIQRQFSVPGYANWVSTHNIWDEFKRR